METMDRRVELDATSAKTSTILSSRSNGPLWGDFQGGTRLFSRRLLFLLVFDTLFWTEGVVEALRCYTDIEASKGNSVECGLSTGCVKIYMDSEEMLLKQQRSYAYPPGFGEMPTLPPRLQGDPVLLRGCFVLAVPDRCYNAKNGMSYCWCSSKDLCNGSLPIIVGGGPPWARWTSLAWVLGLHAVLRHSPLVTG